MNYNWDRGALASESRNKRNEASSLSGVIVDAEKKWPRHVSIGWRQEGYLACKTSTKTLCGQGATGFTRKMAVKTVVCVCVCVCVCPLLLLSRSIHCSFYFRMLTAIRASFNRLCVCTVFAQRLMAVCSDNRCDDLVSIFTLARTHGARSINRWPSHLLCFCRNSVASNNRTAGGNCIHSNKTTDISVENCRRRRLILY